MEGKFKFECAIARGNCAVVFEFPDYGSNKDCGVEFEVNISGLALEPGHSEVNRTEVKEELLRRINEYKLAQFEKFRLRTGDAAAVEARPVVASQTQLNLDSIGG
jgi:hypothetical protein